MPERFKNLYKRETDQRERLRSAISVPVGLLTVFVGLLGTMIRSFWHGQGAAHGVFLVAWIAAAAAVLWAAYYILRAYHGYEYKAMPSALELQEYTATLKQCHAQMGNAPAVADADFEVWIEDRYAAAADHNFYTNAARSEYLYNANRALVVVALCAGIAFVPFLVNDIEREPAPTHVVVDSVHASQGGNGARRQEAAAATAPAVKAAGAAPEKHPGRDDP